MKKSITKILGVAVMFCCAIVILFSQNVKKVSAETSTDAFCIAVVGIGEYCASPDTAEIHFGFRTREDTVEKVYEKANTTLSEITSAIAEIDEETSKNVVKQYTSIYPVSENGIQSYEYQMNLVLKTTKLDLVDKIIVAGSNAGAICYRDVCYTLSNTNEAYNTALQNAKQNAIEKANSLQSNLQLVKLVEESVFCHAKSGIEDICIQARVKAIFKCCDDNEITDEVENKTVKEEIQLDKEHGVQEKNQEIEIENDVLGEEDNFDESEAENLYQENLA